MKKSILNKIILPAIIVSMLAIAGCGQAEDVAVSTQAPVQVDINEVDTEELAQTEIGDAASEKKDEDSKENISEEDINIEDTAKEDQKDEQVKTEATEEATKDEASITEAPKSESGTPVDNHGELKVSGTQLVDKSGNPFQIKGVSTHGMAWFPAFVNKDAFKTIRDEWGANCIRLAMYTEEYGGYCSGGSQADLKAMVNNGVSYATELGMYVIIDWHILSDNNPNNHTQESIAFFDEMSKKYADYDNVIYEICNEPNGGTSWSDIKNYALQVIPVIKANNPDAIIIVGTPTWSQDVDLAAADPISGYTNIMYTLHFYADTHKDSLRAKMDTAISKGIPLFVTEFGITDASGNGAVNTFEGDKWIDALNKNGISYVIWNLSNKSESSALINSGCSKTYGWSESDLSSQGKWYVGVLEGKATGTTEGSPDTGKEDNGKEDKPEADSQASSGNLKGELTMTGGWNDGSYNYYQYTLTMTNTGGSVTGWKAVLDYGTSVEVSQSWNGIYTTEGNVLKIAPVDFNSEIPSGGSVETGFIIKTTGTVGDVTLNVA